MNVSLEKKLLQTFSNLYALYLKTQNYHWNLTGPHFYSLHLLLEKHYKIMAEEIDDLAESIREFEIKVPANFTFFAENTLIENAKENTTWQQQLDDLLISHKLLQKDLNMLLGGKELDGLHAQEDLLTQILRNHRQMMWMLNSTLH